ncbi:DinB family protein [Shivajiella indica]|uniref:DinB family protein n=1 Tax=Shivajiella indica TaxID=872115 RepID=A0ABW5B558_9BACT
MKAFFNDLLEYTYRSNLETILILERNESKISAKTLNIVSHLLNAHHIWNHRILGKKPRFGVWDLQQIENLGEFNKECFERSKRILKNLAFSKQITYTTSKGDTFSSTIQEILFHIVNHSTYHRGQIMAQLRESGLEPISTDFIFYKR